MKALWLVVPLLVIGGCKKKAPEPAAPPPKAAVVKAPEPIPEAVVEKMAETFKKVHFALDSAKLDEASKTALNANAVLMAKYPRLRLEVQGHADERGTTDYNLALGDQRANAVTGQLALMGVGKDRLTVVSYGEEKPERSGSNEVAWSENRRCEFIILTADGNVKGTDGK